MFKLTYPTKCAFIYDFCQFLKTATISFEKVTHYFQ